MQAITIVCVPGSHVIDAPRGTVITREVPNTLDISLVGQDGAPVDTTAVVTWEFGITRGFLGAQSLLAGVSGIVGNGTGPVITLDTHTEEMAAYLAGKYSAVGYATLKGYDSTGAVKMSYTFPVTLQNIGYDDTVADTAALDGLVYTKAMTDAKFAAIGDAIPAAAESSRGTIALATAEEAAAGVEAGKAVTPATLGAVLADEIPVIPPIPADLSDLSDTTGILTGKEPAANKTQAVDAEDPSADRFPSEAAVVNYVSGVTDDIEAALDAIPADLSDLSDETGILAGKEPSTNKATDFTVVDDTKFPTTQAVASYVAAIPAATESSRGTIALATAEDAAAGVDAGKAITPATLKPLVDAKEPTANKTQEIDAVTPSADKFPSEAAVVAYVEGAVTDALGDIDAALDELIGGTP